MGVIKNNDTANFMPYIMLNMMALVNMSFDKRQRHPAEFWQVVLSRLREGPAV